MKQVHEDRLASAAQFFSLLEDSHVGWLPKLRRTLTKISNQRRGFDPAEKSSAGVQKVWQRLFDRSDYHQWDHSPGYCRQIAQRLIIKDGRICLQTGRLYVAQDTASKTPR